MYFPLSLVEENSTSQKVIRQFEKLILSHPNNHTLFFEALQTRLRREKLNKNNF